MCTRHFLSRSFVLLAAGHVLAACQGVGGSSLLERLDERSGVTVVSERQALVFARTETRYSASARDYLYLGPVETNRQGERDYYLWVGIATTLDRGYLAAPLVLPDRLYIAARGELMEFRLRPWPQLAPTVRLTPVYRTAVQIQAQLAARVTLHQLALLAAEPLQSLETAAEQGGTRQYFRWDTGQTWSGFPDARPGPDPHQSEQP